jgi:hypothetical protein
MRAPFLLCIDNDGNRSDLARSLTTKVDSFIGTVTATDQPAIILVDHASPAIANIIDGNVSVIGASVTSTVALNDSSRITRNTPHDVYP